MATYVKYQLATEKMVEGGNMGSDTWQRKKVLKDIKRLNELILRREIDTLITTFQPHDETDDEEALMLLL